MLTAVAVVARVMLFLARVSWTPLERVVASGGTRKDERERRGDGGVSRYHGGCALLAARMRKKTRCACPWFGAERITQRVPVRKIASTATRLSKSVYYGTPLLSPLDCPSIVDPPVMNLKSVWVPA